MTRKRRETEHAWSQEHLSHYVEDNLGWLARRRLELHAAECPDCSLGVRAVRSLIRLLRSAGDGGGERAPESVFDRVRAAAGAKRANRGNGSEL